ncbi:hypothetical protein F2P79_019320 [Pimephales promelas]|nr:hypothetical protein F2P79_019298 [Pimephales promelas]KAG1935498.1 hypothetical protein F2P79_019320 [Pimephales promelas]
MPKNNKKLMGKMITMLMNLILGKLSTLGQEMKCRSGLNYNIQRTRNLKVRELLALILAMMYLLQQLPQVQSLQEISQLKQVPPQENNTNQRNLSPLTPKTLASKILNTQRKEHRTPNGMSLISLAKPTEAPDGSFTTAMKKIKKLRDEVTENAGRDRSFGSMLASAAAKQMINVSVRPSGVDVGCVNEILPSAPDLDELDEFL